MGEILVQPQTILEEEPRVEIEHQDALEQLSFPKLDGILFPIVVENADIIAPCPWMGGEEVSLTVALNDYYQPMTEENADEVIADVQMFLAGQVRSEEERINEPEVEDLIPSQQESIKDEIEPDSMALRQSSNKVAEFPPKKSPSTPPRTIVPPAAVEMAVTTPDPGEKDTETTAEDLPTEDELINKAFEHAKEDPVAASEAAADMASGTEEISVTAEAEAISETDQPVVDDVPEPLPVQKKGHEPDMVPAFTIPKIDLEPSYVDTTRLDIPHEVAPPSANEAALELPDQQEEVAVEPADTPIDVVSKDETPEFTDDTPGYAVEEGAAADYGTDPEPPSPSHDYQEPGGEDEEAVTDQKPTQIDDPKPPEPADPAVEKIEQLLAELARVADSSEMLEPEGDAAAGEEMETQPDLQAPYAELLGDMRRIRKPEFEDLFASLALELRLEDEADILERLEEIEDPVLHRVVYKTIKALAAIVTIAKKTLTGIGRSALRLHAIESVGGYVVA